MAYLVLTVTWHVFVFFKSGTSTSIYYDTVIYSVLSVTFNKIYMCDVLSTTSFV